MPLNSIEIKLSILDRNGSWIEVHGNTFFLVRLHEKINLLLDIRSYILAWITWKNKICANGVLDNST